MTTRLIGLTGNMGCGKSTVAHMLAKLPGVAIYEMDQIWKEMIPTPFCRKYIEFLIGPEAFKDDKPQLVYIASMIFADSKKRIAIQGFAGLHVMQEIMCRAQISSATIHVVESAMLFESHSNRLISETIVAMCDEEEQMRRVLARMIPEREPLTREEALARMECQWSQEEKIARATFVIDTFCSLPDLEVRVKDLYEQLLSARVS